MCATMPLVIDADGLNAFADDPDRLSGREGRDVIITPHPGEMARLVGMSTDVALELADCCAELGDFEREEEVLARALKQDAGDSRIQPRLCAMRVRLSRADDMAMNS